MMATARQPIRIPGIILAAGCSARMGCPKQLLPYKQTTVLGTIVETAKRSQLDDIVVVLGHHARQIQEKVDFAGTRVLINPDYKRGQSTSVKAGVAHIAKDADGAMLLLGDQPTVEKTILNTLITAFANTLAPIVMPVYQGRRGNPVIIGRALFDDLQSSLIGDSGARVLFSKYADKIQRVGVDTDSIHFDLDVMEDYRRLLALSSPERHPIVTRE